MRQFPILSEEISELGLNLSVTRKESESAWTRTIRTQVVFEAEFEEPTKKIGQRHRTRPPILAIHKIKQSKKKMSLHTS